MSFSLFLPDSVNFDDWSVWEERLCKQPTEMPCGRWFFFEKHRGLAWVLAETQGGVFSREASGLFHTWTPILTPSRAVWREEMAQLL